MDMTLGFLNMLSPMHLLFLGIVALLLFGNRLPEVARSLGRSVNEFKKGLKEVKDNFDDAAGDDPPEDGQSRRKSLHAPRDRDFNDPEYDDEREPIRRESRPRQAEKPREARSDADYDDDENAR